MSDPHDVTAERADAGPELPPESAFRHAADLAQSEVALLRAEMARNVRRFKYGVVWMAVGFGLAVVTLALVPVVAILGLMHFHIGPFLASATVLGVVAAGAAVSIRQAGRGLSLRRLIPWETMDSLRQDAAAIWTAVTTRPRDDMSGPVQD